MIGVVAELTVNEGQQADFEKVASELVAAVNANEPGCKLYRLFKVRDASTEYVFMEQYLDQAAIDTHRASEHFKRLGRAMGPFLNGAPRVKRMDIVG
jgi:quinol monooxygenase YgiN